MSLFQRFHDRWHAEAENQLRIEMEAQNKVIEEESEDKLWLISDFSVDPAAQLVDRFLEDDPLDIGEVKVTSTWHEDDPHEVRRFREA